VNIISGGFDSVGNLVESGILATRYAAVLFVFIANKEERPRNCFLCGGLALCLEPDDPYIEELAHEFYSASDVSKHFRRKHLKNIREGDDIECGACYILLYHKMHLQRHAL